MTTVPDCDLGFRERWMVLSPLDQRVYSEHLRAAFPDLQFVDDPWPARGEHPPELVFHESLESCQTHVVELVLSSGWTPTWRPDDNRIHWYLVDLPLPYGRIERGGDTERWQGGPEEMTTTRITMTIQKANKAHESAARKVLRLLRKVAADGMLQKVAYPSLEPIGDPYPNRSWIGRDAYRWCLEAPDRVLGREGHQTVGTRAAG